MDPYRILPRSALLEKAYIVALIIGNGRVRAFSYMTRSERSDELHIAFLKSQGVYIGEDTTVITTSFATEIEQAAYFMQCNYKIKAARFILRRIAE